MNGLWLQKERIHKLSFMLHAVGSIPHPSSCQCSVSRTLHQELSQVCILLLYTSQMYNIMWVIVAYVSFVTEVEHRICYLKIIPLHRICHNIFTSASDIGMIVQNNTMVPSGVHDIDHHWYSCVTAATYMHFSLLF